MQSDDHLFECSRTGHRIDFRADMALKAGEKLGPFEVIEPIVYIENFFDYLEREVPLD